MYRGSRGGKKGKFKKEGNLRIGKRDLENGSSQNFEKELKQKWEGDCAITMFIGLECLCD
jgi:hypothetical protein